MPIPVIIDTDPGVDDVIAILLAIASPELEILAYSISYGNTDIESSYRNILKVYRILELHLENYPSDAERFPNFNTKRKPILAKGCAAPLEGALHSAQYFHGRDGLGDVSDRHPDLSLSTEALPKVHSYLEISNQSGVQVGLDILKCWPSRSVTYIALGPLTNLALMMREDNQLITDRIGRIVCMGGALDVAGNTTPVAEFNFFADPYAVKELLVSTPFHKGLPRDRFLMLPLDITTPHELPFTTYKSIVDNAFHNSAYPSTSENKSLLTHFTSSFLERTREVMLQFGKDSMELHDIVAVWCAMEHPPFLDSETMTLAPGWQANPRVFDIERTGELTRGMLLTDRRDDQSTARIGNNRAQEQDILNNLGNNNQTIIPSSPRILCINKTPGPKVLLQLLLSRVWGCSI